MIIVDASVLVNALTDDGPVGRASRVELARDDHWAAPEHVRVEAFSAIRGLHLGRKIGTSRASDAIDALVASSIDLVSTKPLLPRMWELRDKVSGYDAAYVAAAESRGCTLLTADARLARVEGLSCEVLLTV